ncbi:MAG: hypothetical protein JSW55_13585, partial [Chloroflexota bacterium]
YDRPLAMDQHADNFAWFRRMLAQRELRASPQLEQEAQAIIACLQKPDGPRVYTRGDVCPSNVAYRDRRMRFYDFEMGAFRNAFLSAAYFRISHLSCFNGSLIPLELQAEAEEIYLQALAPIAPDAAAHQMEYAAAATAMLIWMLSAGLDKKDRPRHLATRRQRLFTALSLYVGNAVFAAPFPYTAEALSRLHRKLDVQWTKEEKTILPFPAFR